MYDFAGSFERTRSERTSLAAHTEAVNIFVNIDRDLLLPTYYIQPRQFFDSSHLVLNLCGENLSCLHL